MEKGVPIRVATATPTNTTPTGNRAARLALGPSTRSKFTPCWNEALEKWQETEKGKAEFAALQSIVDQRPDEDIDFLYKIQPDLDPSGKWRLRLKRCEPLLNAFRGLAVTLAATDPNKVAPIIVHSVFASLNILFNRIAPENRDKMLDLLFGCSDAIRECASFELNGQGWLKDPADHIRRDFPILYLRALRLIYKVQKSSTDIQHKHHHANLSKQFMARGQALWKELTDRMVVWESEYAEIKRLVGDWTRKKKDAEEDAKAKEYIAGVRKWLRAPNDPELTLDDFKQKLTPDGKYRDAAQWFLGNADFETWCEGFQAPPRHPHKRVLWLRGGYGTGKTTILYHTYLAMLNEPEYQLLDKELVVGRYFCNATATGNTGPTHDTVIRGLLRRLALSPGYTLVEPVKTLYDSSTFLPAGRPTEQVLESPVEEITPLHAWKETFKKVITNTASYYVFIVDALDECLDSSEVEKLLDFMGDVLKKHSNVSFLCSSHRQINMGDYFNRNMLLPTDVTAERTAEQMERFVREEIQRRRLKTNNSIFYMDPSLMARLKAFLLRNAGGMFEWVKACLNIFLPESDVKKKTIRSANVADKLLTEFEKGNPYALKDFDRMKQIYERLWNLNSTVDSEQLQTMPRLFEITLASFNPQTPESLSIALRIQDNIFDNYPASEDVQSLYSNFLEFHSGLRTLRFVHSSARQFIINKICAPPTSTTYNDKDRESILLKQAHLGMARLYLNVMSSVTHQFLQTLKPKIQDWNDMHHNRHAKALYQNQAGRKQPPDTGTADYLFQYLARDGLRHVGLAATKRSIRDALWRETIDCVILNPQSAFGFTLTMGLYPVVGHVSSWPVFRDQQKTADLLPIHTLVCLSLLHEDDIAVLCGESKYGDQVPRRLGSPSAMPRLIQSAMHRGFPMSRFDVRPATANPPLLDLSGGVTALQLACMCTNAKAVHTILRTLYFHCPQFIGHQLCDSPPNHSPLAIAIRLHHVPIAGLLLETDRSRRREGRSEFFVSKQWASEVVSYSGITVPLLLKVISTFELHEMRQILDVARPEDMNVRIGKGITALHEAAAHRDAGMVRMLIEEYGANPNPLDKRGSSPAFFAFMYNKQDTLKYFKSLRIPVEFPGHKRGGWADKNPNPI